MKSKNEEINNIFLNGKNYFDTISYRLSNNDILQNIIKKIDDSPILSKATKNEISAEEQFITLLDKLVINFKRNFQKINELTGVTLELILSANIQECEKYLLSKKDIGDNDNIQYFEKSISKIYISNFIKNGKYISTVKDILNDINIELKDIKDYSYDEIKKIEQLLSNLVFCYDSNFQLVYLFDSIDYSIKMKSKTKSSKDILNCKNGIITLYDSIYENIFDNYLKRKHLIELFK